ncbi:hypothetical protein K1T71_008185 [Dendrolimus kikuchii]|uniref:Uncharacterized protein n=1 Tax=Dendrolimus kikuchii TaxID=765133 RepID=A0ACC1CWC2_9NEOP|nr:hypothetical protein K1T71_008185 [Dendrolimus kikuchii]
MQKVVFLGLLLVASAVCSVEVNIGRGYHEEIGIPLAESIRAAEEEALARSADSKDGRIVGGAVAPTNAHPYLAGLIISFWNIAGSSACGSSLLSQNRLVTAAHCWFDGRNQAWQFLVVLGSNMLFSGGTRIATSSVIMHPQWLPSLLANDVAVIFLPTSVTFSTSIQPIALPSTTDLNNNFAGQWAVAAGFGRTSDSQVGISINAVISQVNLQVITETQCRAVFGHFILPSTICTNGAGGVGICNGDSGGPLVINRNGQNILVGISSFVAANGCQLGFPSAFARVTSFYNFLIQHL